MRASILIAAVGVSTALVVAPVSAQLRANAGVVAGNANIGPQFQCATSGSTIGAPYFEGISIPTEGISACGLFGMIDDKTALVGPLFANATGTGPMSGSGTFTGASSARAQYWNLGVAASGVSTGGSSGTTYRQAAGYASFAEDVVFTSPTYANGTAGFANFKFVIDGMMKSVPNAPYGQQGDVVFSILANNILWTAFAGTELDNQLPFLRGGSTGIPGHFVSTPGMFIGSDSITTFANFNMTYGVPLHVEVSMFTTVSPCCFGASFDSNFLNSAFLTGIDAYGPGAVKNDNFLAVGMSSGIRVNAQGIIVDPVTPPGTTVPEPSAVSLMLMGMIAVAAAARRKGVGRTARL